MQKVRDAFAETPWLKWAVGAAAVLIVVFVVVQVRSCGSAPFLEGDALAETVSVNYADTGDTLDVPIGFVTRDLINHDGPVTTESRLTNPKSQNRTGVVQDAKRWAKIIESVNQHKAETAPR